MIWSYKSKLPNLVTEEISVRNKYIDMPVLRCLWEGADKVMRCNHEHDTRHNAVSSSGKMQFGIRSFLWLVFVSAQSVLNETTCQLRCRPLLSLEILLMTGLDEELYTHFQSPVIWLR